MDFKDLNNKQCSCRVKLTNPMTVKRLQKEYAKQILSVMRHEEVSFLTAKLYLIDLITSDEVKELIIKEL